MSSYALNYRVNNDKIYLEFYTHKFEEEADMASLVYLHNKNNGVTYVYSNHSYRDKETHKVKHDRKCIGHLDPDTGEVVPNRQRRKVDAKQSAPTAACNVEDIGVSMLAENAAQQSGLLRILKETFPDDWKAMLTCAYYLVSEGRSLCHAEQWSSSARTPFGGRLGDQRISELLTRITAEKQQAFFAKWTGTNYAREDFFALDITSVSSYSEQNSFVRNGYNRDKEALPQINLLMVTGEKTHLPVYYQMLPGSIHDVSTLRMNLQKMYLFDMKSLSLVMDKGFYSERNIDELYRLHHKFLIGVPFSTSLADKAVERNREAIVSHHHLIEVMGNELYAVTESKPWKGSHRMYVHTYFDSFKAAMDERNFNHKLLGWHDELVNNHPIAENQKYYDRFFIIKDTPKRGRKVEYNEEAIASYKKNHAGWFVLIGNKIKDAAEALSVYRRKDAVEKEFDDLKNDLDMKRLRMHTPRSVEGRLFIQFLASILTAWLRNKLREAGWLKNTTLQEVVDEMKSLREVSVGKRKRLMTTLTSKQQKILNLYQITA